MHEDQEETYECLNLIVVIPGQSTRRQGHENNDENNEEFGCQCCVRICHCMDHGTTAPYYWRNEDYYYHSPANLPSKWNDYNFPKLSMNSCWVEYGKHPIWPARFHKISKVITGSTFNYNDKSANKKQIWEKNELSIQHVRNSLFKYTPEFSDECMELATNYYK